MKVQLLAATMVRVPDGDWLDERSVWQEKFNEYSFHEEFTEDADELAEIAGRLCYKSWKRPNPATATNEGYIQNIINQQHFSVLEHASATFWISGVSRSLTHELVRHRHLSFSQVSQRYVNEDTDELSLDGMAYHPAAKDNIHYVGAIQTATRNARAVYGDLVEMFVKNGMDRKTARGAARGVLPNAVTTELIVTGNHRTWREVLAKRLAPGADAEIRELAGLLLEELKACAPNTYQDFTEK